MTIIIGLGNPGKKFNHTRHNAGFEVLDFFATQNGFPDFEISKRHKSLISENNEVALVKPETFMNDSGRATAAILKNKNEPTLIVVHDDIDLPLGKIKFTKDSGAGGHKGVDSIIQQVGNNNFIQLKIGIGAEGEKVKALEVVLEKFSKEEQEIMEGVIKKSAEALKYLTENGIEKTMNEYN
ncbi:MAG: aminoacyl-tRNA hydrolase [Candidatus Staskawiczbacteria bacterium]|nr:aminoacyl-tRNA hydrolase [Candidatus Staskawiczbacteria bacterium]